MALKKPSKVDDFPFFMVTHALTLISKKSKASDKKILMEKLWKEFPSKLSLYPLLRLLLPQLDLSRSTYGIKEKSIGQLYISAIPLSKTSNDAKKLKSWKNPKIAGQYCGDFANVLLSVLNKRCTSKPIKTIGNVNDDLDRLIKCKDKQERVQWFGMLMQYYTSNEQFWLVRMILKDLKCGMRYESTLKAFHSKALTLYNNTNSLENVADLIVNPQKYKDDISFTIKLFNPISPMLAQRGKWKDVVREMNEVNELYLKANPNMGNNNDNKYIFGIEIKFDGERVMIHYRKNDRIMFFSRNAVDLQQKYGYVSVFEDIIRENFTCESCILDGELMAWDETENKFIPFGKNRTVANDILNNKNCKQHLCFMAFDILMVDDISTMELTLLRRKAVLKEVFMEKKTYLERVDTIVGITDKIGVMDALDKALFEHHEGIMVKALNSQYKCTRDKSWQKLKPDYVNEMTETMDLIILGGYFGEGKRRVGDISHFLLGCAKKNLPSSTSMDMNMNDDNDDDIDSYPTEFYTFCKVGSGYSDTELNDLRQRLNDYWVPYNPRTAKNDPGLKHLMGWNPEINDVPDVYIDPKNSVLIELLCNEIIPTVKGKFSAGLTVRFPRCKHIRYDKGWYECMWLYGLRYIYIILV